MPISSSDITHNAPVRGSVGAYGELLGVPLYKTVAAKTSNYTMVPADCGKIFTNRAATAAITFTLPPVTSLATGWWVIVYSVDNDGIVVASNGSSDNITGKNDATADSCTMTTNSLAIGAGLMLIWDGTSWLTFQAGNGATYTYA